MNRQEMFNDMEKALRAHCPVEELLDEIPFDLYSANMVIYGYGNLKQALTEYCNHVQCNIIEQLDVDLSIREKVNKIIDETLKEFLKND